MIAIWCTLPTSVMLTAMVIIYFDTYIACGLILVLAYKLGNLINRYYNDR